jgi:cytochrome P450
LLYCCTKLNIFSLLEQQLLDLCKDLFLAGSDTSFNSLTFSLVFMLNFPDVQRKVQEELDRVVGQDRLPGLDDKAKYVEK